MTLLLTQLIANPDLALILLLAGILLLYAEFNRPGTVLLAAVGTLFSMLALYGLALHTVQPTALALALTALVLISAGVRFTPLAFLGTVVLIYALRNLLPENPRIHLTTAVFASLIFSSVTFWLGRIALQARRNKRQPNPTPHPASSARRVD